MKDWEPEGLGVFKSTEDGHPHTHCGLFYKGLSTKLGWYKNHKHGHEEKG